MEIEIKQRLIEQAQRAQAPQSTPGAEPSMTTGTELIPKQAAEVTDEACTPKGAHGLRQGGGHGHEHSAYLEEAPRGIESKEDSVSDLQISSHISGADRAPVRLVPKGGGLRRKGHGDAAPAVHHSQETCKPSQLVPSTVGTANPPQKDGATDGTPEGPQFKVKLKIVDQ